MHNGDHSLEIDSIAIVRPSLRADCEKASGFCQQWLGTREQ